jgi:hypothetical protein
MWWVLSRHQKVSCQQSLRVTVGDWLFQIVLVIVCQFCCAEKLHLPLLEHIFLVIFTIDMLFLYITLFFTFSLILLMLVGGAPNLHAF